MTCELDKGTETVSVPLPAVISADLRLNTPRFASLPAVMKAKKKPLEVLELAALWADAASADVCRCCERKRRRHAAAGACLPDVASLVSALRDEARVL